MSSHTVSLGSIRIHNEKPFLYIAGPCALETEAKAIAIAKNLAALTRRLRIPYVFKASFDKANRTSVQSYRGPGLTSGLAMLQRVRETVGCPLLTDIHCRQDVAAVASVVDIIQIPAFLCRQTDLLLACADTGKIINVKKGQFVSPWEMENVIRKIESRGNKNILLTERGFSFGYNNLVVDMRSLAIMKTFGYPVVYDATHSVQLPGGKGNASGGQRHFVAPLAQAAAAIGLAGLFTEVHPKPDEALSDGPNSLRLADVPAFLKTLIKIDRAVK